MDQIEYNYWCLKIETAEFEQEAVISKKEFWNLRLGVLKDEITKSKGHTTNPKEALLNAEDLACTECEHSMLPCTAEICQDCQDHSNFVPKQGK